MVETCETMETEKENEMHVIRYKSWKEDFDACFPKSELAVIGINEKGIHPNTDLNASPKSDGNNNKSVAAMPQVPKNDESKEVGTNAVKEYGSHPDGEGNGVLEMDTNYIPGSPIVPLYDGIVEDLRPDLIPDVIENEKSILKEMVTEFEQRGCVTVLFENLTSACKNIEDIDEKITFAIQSIVANAQERYEDDLTSSNVATFTTYAAIQLDRIKAINDLRIKKCKVVESFVDDRLKDIENCFGLDWWDKTEEEIESLDAKDDPGEMSVLRSFGEEWILYYQDRKKKKLEPLFMILKQLKCYEKLIFSWLDRDICCDESELERYHNEAWTSSTFSPEAGVHTKRLIPKILEIADHIFSKLESTNRERVESETRIARQAVQHALATYSDIISREMQEPLSPSKLKSLHEQISTKVVDSFYGLSTFAYTHPWKLERDNLLTTIATAYEEKKQKNDSKKSQVAELDKVIQNYVTDFSVGAIQLFLKEVTETGWGSWLYDYWEAASESFKVKSPDAGPEALAKLRTRIQETIVRLGIKERLQTRPVAALKNPEPGYVAEIATETDLQPIEQFSRDQTTEITLPTMANVVTAAKPPLISTVPVPSLPLQPPGPCTSNGLNPKTVVLPQTAGALSDYLFQKFSTKQKWMEAEPLPPGTEPKIAPKSPAPLPEITGPPAPPNPAHKSGSEPVTAEVSLPSDNSKLYRPIFVPIRILNSSIARATKEKSVTDPPPLVKVPKPQNSGTRAKDLSEQTNGGKELDSVEPTLKLAPVVIPTTRISTKPLPQSVKASKSPALPKSVVRLIDPSPRPASEKWKDWSPRLTSVTTKEVKSAQTSGTPKGWSPWGTPGNRWDWSPAVKTPTALRQRESPGPVGEWSPAIGTPKELSQRETPGPVGEWSPQETTRIVANYSWSPEVYGAAQDWTPGNAAEWSPEETTRAAMDWSPRQKSPTNWSPRNTPTVSRNPSPKATGTWDYPQPSKPTLSCVTERGRTTTSPRELASLPLNILHQKASALKRTLNLESSSESSSDGELPEIPSNKLPHSSTEASLLETIPLILPKSSQSKLFYQHHPNTKLVSTCGIGIVFCSGKAHVSVKVSGGAKNFSMSSTLNVMQGAEGPVVSNRSRKGITCIEIYDYLTKPHFKQTVGSYQYRKSREHNPLWAEEVIGLFFCQLKKAIYKLCKRDLDLDEVAIALPGFISSSCKQRLKSSLQLAGFKNSVIVQTTTAIGMTFLEANHPESDTYLLVIWIQLITIDVALLKVSKGKVITIGTDATVSFRRLTDYYNLINKLPGMVNSVIKNGGIKKSDVERCAYAIEDSHMESNAAKKGTNSLVTRVHQQLRDCLGNIIITPCSILEGMLPGLVSIAGKRSAFGPTSDSYQELFRHVIELDKKPYALKKIRIASEGEKAKEKTIVVPASFGFQDMSYICSRSAEYNIKEMEIFVTDCMRKSNSNITISVNPEGIISASCEVDSQLTRASTEDRSWHPCGQHMPLESLKWAEKRVSGIIRASEDVCEKYTYNDCKRSPVKKRKRN